jgi:hypothetical protein
MTDRFGFQTKGVQSEDYCWNACDVYRKSTDSPAALMYRSDVRGGFLVRGDYHQQYLAKNPAGYCGLGGCGASYESRMRRRWRSGRFTSGREDHNRRHFREALSRGATADARERRARSWRAAGRSPGPAETAPPGAGTLRKLSRGAMSFSDAIASISRESEIDAAVRPAFGRRCCRR